jgi:hypothetical protein
MEAAFFDLRSVYKRSQSDQPQRADHPQENVGHVFVCLNQVFRDAREALHHLFGAFAGEVSRDSQDGRKYK